MTGGAPLAYRMEALDAFSIAGYAAPIGKNARENFQSVPALWERVAREETLAKLLRMHTGRCCLACWARPARRARAGST